MKLVFEGLEQPLELRRGRVAALQVENPTFFARIARSITTQDEDNGLERFSLWEGEEQVRAKDSFLVVSDLLNLPWDHRLLLGSVIKKMERELLEDEDLRQLIEAAQQKISSGLLSLGLGYGSDYGFGQEWDFKRYLKMMAFGIDIHDDEPYLENVTKFISLASDAGCKQIVVFVNLKTFLMENDYKSFLDHVFYTGLRVLLLENKCDNRVYENEDKYVVDLQFLES